ncbi:MAG: hypothetical protein IT429_24870 [Gemmataceae bacterium]|nr:hypothetical protein [Gemmataceae bacterium]
MSLPKRLARVEGLLLPAPGCATCKGWTGVVLEGDDGPHRPERCPGCGRLVPATVVVWIVGVRIALI